MRPAESKLAELTERLSATAAGLDVNDLTTLAELHTGFEAVTAYARELPAAARAALRDVADLATVAATTLEKIVLREVDDVTAALDRVRQTVRDLRRFAEGAPSEPTPGDVLVEVPVAADDASLVADFTSEADEHLESAEGGLLKLGDDPTNAATVALVFRAFHTIKGVAGFLNLRQIGALAHAAESVLDLVRQGSMQLVGDRLAVMLAAVDAMKALFSDLGAASRAGRAPAALPHLPALLERLRGCAAEPAFRAREGGELFEGRKRPAAEPLGSLCSETTAKVSAERLGRLMELVDELVIAQSVVAQDVAAGGRRLARDVAHLGEVARALQGLAISLRRVPIEGVFQKMARVARDVAGKVGKEIDFRASGGDTELDRDVVGAVGDALVHMVRNGIDHGIEPPDERLRAGKPRAGRVELRAWHRDGRVVVEITDDGRGLSTGRLLAKAREAGLIDAGDELTEREIFELIFHPGLSTAETVTDLSGRGVGMDVVKANVEALCGTIDVASVPGAGSTFTIFLPRKLAGIASDNQCPAGLV